MIELNLKQKSGLQTITSHPHYDRYDEAGSKDSTEGHYPRFSALQITPEDDYLAAVSIESNEGIPTIRVWLLEIKQDANSIFPKIELVKQKQIEEKERYSTEKGWSEHVSDYRPQFVNFSMKQNDRNILLVFPRNPSKFYIFIIKKGEFIEYQSVNLPSLNTDNNLKTGKTYLNDGCLMDNILYLTLHCSTILKITFRL